MLFLEPQAEVSEQATYRKWHKITFFFLNCTPVFFFLNVFSNFLPQQMLTQMTSPKASYHTSLKCNACKQTFWCLKMCRFKTDQLSHHSDIFIYSYLLFCKWCWYVTDSRECGNRHVVWTLRIISMLLPMSERHAFSLRPHWISCTSAKCYFSEDQFAYKSFLLVWPSTANWTGLSGWWEAVTITVATGGNIH